MTSGFLFEWCFDSISSSVYYYINTKEYEMEEVLLVKQYFIVIFAVSRPQKLHSLISFGSSSTSLRFIQNCKIPE
jgi:hypothetical protein